MSHGKSLYVKGTVEVEIGGKKTAFTEEEKVGLVMNHNSISGDATKAKKDVVNALNFVIDKAWKKTKPRNPAECPEVSDDDVEWDFYTAR